MFHRGNGEPFLLRMARIADLTQHVGDNPVNGSAGK